MLRWMFRRASVALDIKPFLESRKHSGANGSYLMQLNQRSIPDPKMLHFSAESFSETRYHSPFPAKKKISLPVAIRI